MKKVTIFILTLAFAILNLGFTTYSLEEKPNHGKLMLFINEMRTPSIKVGTDNYIKINDLKKVGFDISLDEESKEINIYQNPNLIMKTFETYDYKIENLPLEDTDFTVNINECTVDAKQINKDIVINIESFIKVEDFDFYKSVDTKDDSFYIKITNSSDFINSFTKPGKVKVHIKEKENHLYSGNNKVGLIKDNIEWISLDYIKELIEFDSISEEKDKEEMWIYFKKGNYAVEIQIEDGRKAFAECGPFDMDFIVTPFELDGELYVPLINAIQLFNLEIIREKDLQKNENIATAGFGNIMNGMNIIEKEGWIYYINPSDPSRLYKTHENKKENIKISNDHVKQFYIDKDKIFYVAYGNEEKKKGIYKMNLDGTDSQQIVEGDISFLSISHDKLYYCDRANGGNLYQVDKNTGNGKRLIEGKITYPNIVNGWVYYININDNNSIYRCRLDGSYNIKISNGKAKCLNVDNKKVYFSDYNNSYFMNHDGSFKNRLYNDSANDILVSENYIFWIDNYKVYKQNKNSILSNLVNQNSRIRGIGLKDDKLNILEDKQLRTFYEYDTNNGKSEVLEIEDSHKIEKISYPYIYYIKSDGKLEKYNINTKVSETIISQKFHKVYDIIDDWIYYSIWEEGLYRVKTDGTNTTKLLDKNIDIYHINIDSSGIYCIVSQASKDGKTINNYYRVDLDGRNKQVVINDLTYPFYSKLSKEYIYYNQKGIYRIKKDGTENKKVIDKSIWDFSIIDDYIIYICERDLYFISYEGKEEKKIAEGMEYSFTKYKDDIYYLKQEDTENLELYRYNLINKKTERVFNSELNRVDFLTVKDNYLLINGLSEKSDHSNSLLYLIDMETNKIDKVAHKIENSRMVYLNSLFMEKNYIYYIMMQFKTDFMLGIE